MADAVSAAPSATTEVERFIAAKSAAALEEFYAKSRRDVLAAQQDPTAANRLDNNASVWANKEGGFPVADAGIDRVQWASDWDRGLEQILAASVQGTTMKELFNTSQYEDCSPKDWFMLVGDERRREVLSLAIEDTCWCSVLGQDARALCLEINSTSLLRRRGLELFAFHDRYIESASSTSTGRDMVRSKWWSSALRLDDVPQVQHAGYRYTYDLYTVTRSYFLFQFTWLSWQHILGAWMRDMQGQSMVSRLIWNAGPKGIQEMISMRKEAKNGAGQRCERCDRTPEGFAADVRFLICGACKRGLNFTYHYCSKACQKADWPTHKLACGKEKISKARAEGRPEYKRSFNLLLQLAMQTKEPSADYLLFKLDRSFSASATPYKVVFPDDDSSQEKRALFKQKRDLATIDADRTGLDIVAKCLVNALAADSCSSGITQEQIVRQLTDEYEVDVRSRLEKLQADLAIEGDEQRYVGMVIQGNIDLHEWSIPFRMSEEQG
ncbi:hypothetical protein CONPUDRAFT_161850 [Coniophora puteana RWD-64-598 SS2]|uniref:MYND-type domain-containing protein n=1 Tax=Coniophora puteana (strain RWD-64-598) TaxID=741705 RepID=A0A5M3N748_CONPW|nr:uncharacterized protein CONPUDRAFT_161850 [Coniophora puteana RWD-64-598 SS2]EIW87269.1 hypothetical protein CONPUDRAFT_161850 [Coniophora puteana RWD-64-598 SS2]